MQLTEHFVLAELTRSDTAARNHINNVPDAAGIEKLRALCVHILEPVRVHFGKPLSVNSGYRSVALNATIRGSSNTSQHTLCEAVDYEVSEVSNAAVAVWVRDNLEYDQLILEAYTQGNPHSGWVHTSWKPTDRRGKNGHNGVLTMIPRKGQKPLYLPGLHF